MTMHGCTLHTRFFICLLIAVPAVYARQAPDLLLANVYEETIDVRDYWISEKFDYHGKTRNGLPRFASFLRIRPTE